MRVGVYGCSNAVLELSNHPYLYGLSKRTLGRTSERVQAERAQ